MTASARTLFSYTNAACRSYRQALRVFHDINGDKYANRHENLRKKQGKYNPSLVVTNYSIIVTAVFQK